MLNYFFFLIESLTEENTFFVILKKTSKIKGSDL